MCFCYRVVCKCKHRIACIECFRIFLLALARMWRGGGGGGQMGRGGCLWELEREGFNFCLHLCISGHCHNTVGHMLEVREIPHARTFFCLFVFLFDVLSTPPLGIQTSHHEMNSGWFNYRMCSPKILFTWLNTSLLLLLENHFWYVQTQGKTHIRHARDTH